MMLKEIVEHVKSESRRKPQDNLTNMLGTTGVNVVNYENQGRSGHQHSAKKLNSSEFPEYVHGEKLTITQLKV